jgi:hypothetical protein
MMSGFTATVRGRSVVGGHGLVRRTVALRVLRVLVVTTFVALTLLAGAVIGRLGGQGVPAPSVAPPPRPAISLQPTACRTLATLARVVPRRV